jgi:hypothetical protein
MRRRVLHPVQQHVLNPLDKLAFRCLTASSTMSTSPLTVRIDLDPQ